MIVAAISGRSGIVKNFALTVLPTQPAEVPALEKNIAMQGLEYRPLRQVTQVLPIPKGHDRQVRIIAYPKGQIRQVRILAYP